MKRDEPTCPLCGAVLSCDSCGPLEGGPVWVRKGETRPAPHEEGQEGDWVYACDRCAGTKRG